MATDKVKTLIGFAMKAGKVVFGTDNIEYSRTKRLIILCNTLSENSRNKVVAHCGKVPVLLVTQGTLAEITHRENCKAIAITDKQMSEAMLNNKNGNYRLITEVR